MSQRSRATPWWADCSLGGHDPKTLNSAGVDTCALCRPRPARYFLGLIENNTAKKWLAKVPQVSPFGCEGGFRAWLREKEDLGPYRKTIQSGVLQTGVITTDMVLDEASKINERNLRREKAMAEEKPLHAQVAAGAEFECPVCLRPRGPNDYEGLENTPDWRERCWNCGTDAPAREKRGAPHAPAATVPALADLGERVGLPCGAECRTQYDAAGMLVIHHVLSANERCREHRDCYYHADGVHYYRPIPMEVP